MEIPLTLMLAAWLGCGALAGPWPAPATPPPAVAPAKGALPFVENDYARALADAQRRHVPLFVENWAMW